MSTIIKNEIFKRDNFGGWVDDGLEQDDHQSGEVAGCRDSLTRGTTWPELGRGGAWRGVSRCQTFRSQFCQDSVMVQMRGTEGKARTHRFRPDESGLGGPFPEMGLSEVQSEALMTSWMCYGWTPRNA